MDKKPIYVVITPVRDEEKHIAKTIYSMEQQNLLPAKWVIVNDGSTDNTFQIMHTASKRHKWINTVDRPNRGFRKSGGGVIDAFYDGYAQIAGICWDYLVKLDGDLSFKADYFERCFSYFKENKKLGIAGGLICRSKNDQIIIDSIGDPPFHVRGATKIYRQECWQVIRPLVRAPGWDTIDEIRANKNGWITRTITDIILIQHKATGAADGYWHNCFKNGMADYISGYHPLFMLAKCIKRGMKKPTLIHSFALLMGYVAGYTKGITQQNDSDTIKYLRQEQLKRLTLRKSIYR